MIVKVSHSGFRNALVIWEEENKTNSLRSQNEVSFYQILFTFESLIVVHFPSVNAAGHTGHHGRMG